MITEAFIGFVLMLGAAADTGLRLAMLLRTHANEMEVRARLFNGTGFAMLFIFYLGALMLAPAAQALYHPSIVGYAAFSASGGFVVMGIAFLLTRYFYFIRDEFF